MTQPNELDQSLQTIDQALSGILRLINEPIRTSGEKDKRFVRRISQAINKLSGDQWDMLTDKEKDLCNVFILLQNDTVGPPPKIMDLYTELRERFMKLELSNKAPLTVKPNVEDMIE